MRVGGGHLLELMNTTVALLLVVPLLLATIALSGKLQSIEHENSDLRKKLDSTNIDKPPIIILSEAEGFTFKSGEDTLEVGFQKALNEQIAPTIRKMLRDYKCDIIEVIGHTDRQEIGTRFKSNLDRILLSNTAGSKGSSLTPGSNADLGLMRAWAVIAYLRRQGSWDNTKFYGYSAAQAIRPDGSLASETDSKIDDTKRRIEIRVRRSR